MKKIRLTLLAGLVLALGACEGGFVAPTGRIAIRHTATGGEEITNVWTSEAGGNLWFGVGHFDPSLKINQTGSIPKDEGTYDVRIQIKKTEKFYLYKFPNHYKVEKDKTVTLIFDDEKSRNAELQETE